MTTKNMSFSTPAKNLIRQKWAKPLLKLINEHLGKKLLYLGLPGSEAEDIFEWIDHLYKVFAFQCQDERYPDAYLLLDKKLTDLEDQGKIDTFSLFEGYLEKVIMNGFDDQNKTFNLNEIVTLYNLDYCNQIDFPIKSQNIEGEPITIKKFDSIKKLLEIQSGILDVSTKFVLFLTIHCSYKDKQTKAYLQHNKIYKEYVLKINKVLKGKGSEKNARSLRLYIIENLKPFFYDEGFIPEFLPTVFYEGKADTPMLLFTIIGTKGDEEIKQQEVNKLINSKFIKPNDANENFTHHTLTELDEIEGAYTDSVQAFTTSNTFQNYWSK